MVSLWWVTYPNERWKKFEVVSLLWVTYPIKKKCEVVSLLWVTYPNESGGLIMMGDLPRWRCWSHYDGWPTQIKDVGLIMMGDLPKERWSHYDGWPTQLKWWSHCDGWPTQMQDKRRSHYNGWPTQMKDEKRSHCNGWPTQMKDEKRSHCNGWPTRMIKCDLPGKKTWLEKSWQDKVDKLRFLIAGLTWRPLLMTWLIFLFLWDFPTGRVHLIPFSFQDLNRWFFVIIDSMILSVHNLAELHWGFSCNNSKICAMLWG
jgi:hypothetical protein